MRRSSIIISLVAALALLVLVVGVTRLRAATSRADAAFSTLVSVGRDAQELLALRRRQPTRATGEQPTQDTLARVTATLAEAGIPAERLRNLERESDSELSAGSGERLRALSMRVVLEPVTVVQLGAFLARWRDGQKLWDVSRLELNHTGAADEQEGTYTVRLVITAVYAAQNPAPDARTAPSSAPQTRRTP